MPWVVHKIIGPLITVGDLKDGEPWTTEGGREGNSLIIRVQARNSERISYAGALSDRSLTPIPVPGHTYGITSTYPCYRVLGRWED